MRRRFQQLRIFPEAESIEEKDKNFISLLPNYEKKIRYLIIFTICLLVVYAIGAERGKRQTLVKKEKESILIGTEKVKVTPRIEESKTIAPKEEIQEIRGYIIQVATYKKLPYAENEASNLKKKGFSSFTKRIGDFVVVYVGNFQNKNEAQQNLKKLKKYYSDCFIRKL